MITNFDIPFVLIRDGMSFVDGWKVQGCGVSFEPVGIG